MSFQVQFITHFTETISYLDSVRIALEGGCRWIQLRMKHATEAEVRETAGKALPLCGSTARRLSWTTTWSWSGRPEPTGYT